MALHALTRLYLANRCNTAYIVPSLPPLGLLRLGLGLVIMRNWHRCLACTSLEPEGSYRNTGSDRYNARRGGCRVRVGVSSGSCGYATPAVELSIKTWLTNNILSIPIRDSQDKSRNRVSKSMPRQKRKETNISVKPGRRPSPQPPAPPAASAKRLRVSLACNACRAARERCDGGRPVCGPCSAQSRACSYRTAIKKRGVQAGYLRTIEVALAYVLEKHPETEDDLYQQLTSGSGTIRSESRQLYDRWTNCRVQRQIGRLLADDSNAVFDQNLSRGASDTEGDTLAADAQLHLELGSRQNKPRPNAQLPSNWRRLVDIYFAYTHCWLPIIDKEQVLNAALAIPPEGIAIRSAIDLPPSVAELWAVLALASFQDAASLGSSSETHQPPRQIYAIARDMIPSEDNQLKLSHIKALLIHSVVLIGQGAGLAAWMQIGTTVRLALHMRRKEELGSDCDRSCRSSIAFILSACLMLNTITSACLGQPTFIKVDIEEVRAALDSLTEGAEDEPWDPISGLGNSSSKPLKTSPLRSFKQLCKLSQILSANLDNEGASGDPPFVVTTEDLVQCLDPRFSFCNSLILCKSTPLEPSAFVLHTLFIVATIHIVQRYRSSLLSSLMEVVESYVCALGACGAPPIIVGLLGIVRRLGHVAHMHDYEQAKLDSMTGILRSIWRSESPRQTLTDSSGDTPDLVLGQPSIGCTQYSAALGTDYNAFPDPAFNFAFANDMAPSLASSTPDTHIASMQTYAGSDVSLGQTPYDSLGLSFLGDGWMGGLGEQYIPNADVNDGSQSRPSSTLNEGGSSSRNAGRNTGPRFNINPDLG